MQFITSYNANVTIGGKALNLFTLKEAGINVPHFVVIPQEEVANIISDERLVDKQKERILNFQISEPFIQHLIQQFNNVTYFAVRSSAGDEDGAEFSFAGQFESFLFVRKENLAEKIKQVWCSAFSERVMAYRTTNEISSKPGIAVIVQEMIEAEVAGVAFGIHPVSGNRKEKVISAVYGVGEGLVSGQLNADTFTVYENEIIAEQLALKTHQFILNKDRSGGVRKEEVEISKQNAACLNPLQVKEVANLLHQLYTIYHSYQDVEFAYKNNQLYILQTRPITTLHKLPDAGGEHIIWDNSNIIESYPGVTTPLTFSFISKVYEAVYRQFAAMMGISDEDIDENKETFANMLGLINGRVYYNLLSWYKALAMLPGYSINAEFMEKMMGVKERFDLKPTKARSKFQERWRVLKMIGTILKNLSALPKMRITFINDFNAKMQAYNAIDFSKKNADELMYLYLNFEQTLLKKWKAPLVNDFFAMIYFGVLQKLVVKYKIDDTGTVHNNLMCGARDIISTEPIKRCLKLADLIHANAQAKAIFLNYSSEAILKQLNTLDVEIQNDIEAYLEKFGDRCVGELKLETITYKQNPSAFIQILKAYVEQGVTTQNTHSDTDLKMRSEAEEKVNVALRRQPIKKWLFNYFLKRSRILVSARENLRYERTRAFGVVRALMCNLGEKFFAEGLIEHARDIFFLTKEEIFDFIKGTSVNFNLKELIAYRKKEFHAFEKRTTSERIDTKGITYKGNNFYQKRNVSPLNGDLKGLGCCPGRVKAKVQVVSDPNAVKNLNGDILVTSSTDPGWVTLFPTASAILVERGSLLSHSAIVSREMGKPCIVGITGLLETLQTGDEVEMDGSTGEIRIITKLVNV